MEAKSKTILLWSCLGLLIISWVWLICWLIRAVSRRGTLGPRRNNQQMRGMQVKLGLGTTHYAIFSKGDDARGQGQIDPKRLLVFIHGLGGHLDQLTWGLHGGFSSFLADTSYTVLALDLYGHGFSQAPDIPLAPGDFVKQFEAVLEHLGISQAFDLCGFSHGAFIASDYAASHPRMVKHLVLASPFGCGMYTGYPRPLKKVLACFAALIVHLTFEGNLSQLRTIYRILLNLEGERLPGLLTEIAAASIPTLIVVGSADRDPALRILQTAHTIHKALPNSTLDEIPKGGHMAWATGTADQQSHFRNAILNFVEDSGGSHGVKSRTFGITE